MPRWAFSYDEDKADNSITFKVNLDALPSDVEEVELRGQVQNTDWYMGAIPGGWKPPANMKISGVNRYLDVVSRPFKVVVWKWGTPRPKPEVSRKTKIELRGVRWFTVPYSNGPKEYVYLNLRNVSQNNWVERGLLIVQNVHFFDSSGHEIPLFDKRNVGARVTNFGLTIVNQAQFSPQKPTTDRIVVLVPWDVAPQKGWRHYPGPLRLECEVSDGQCWPTKISTPLTHDIQTDEKMLAFGAPGSH
ncbi:hypothetical protein EON80_32615 [bacterium]|nr:MAG: hypothetical protein EON80_32615 [bacterium]